MVGIWSASSGRRPLRWPSTVGVGGLAAGSSLPAHVYIYCPSNAEHLCHHGASVQDEWCYAPIVTSWRRLTDLSQRMVCRIRRLMAPLLACCVRLPIRLVENEQQQQQQWRQRRLINPTRGDEPSSPLPLSSGWFNGVTSCVITWMERTSWPTA